MMKPGLLATAAVGLIGALSPTGAVADDAYVCDGGRLVYARPETLEKLKETDPCIAGFYALAKPQASPAAAVAIPAPMPSASGAAVVPALKGRAGDPPKAAPSKTLPVTKDARLKPSVPDTAAGTDYRNVRVINAPDSGTLYRHDR